MSNSHISAGHGLADILLIFERAETLIEDSIQREIEMKL